MVSQESRLLQITDLQQKKKRTIDNLFQQSKEYPFKSSKRQRVLLSCPTKQKLFLTRFHQYLTEARPPTHMR